MIAFHIVVGLLALVSGALAFVTSKGGRVHSTSGRVFAGAMLAMCASGALTAVVRENSFSKLNEVAAALTAYLVVTGFATARRSASAARRNEDAIAAVIALAIAVVSCSIGIQAIGQRGAPAPAYFMFGTLAALGAIGDVRKFIDGTEGARRIARHLWRMGTALLIATASFFLGQARVFPEAFRRPALLAVPVLMVLIALVYWLLRVRFTPTHVRVTRFLRKLG